MKQKFQTMMYRMNSKMQQMMVGRHGVDDLGKFVSTLTLICLVISLFTKWEYTFIDINER